MEVDYLEYSVVDSGEDQFEFNEIDNDDDIAFDEVLEKALVNQINNFVGSATAYYEPAGNDFGLSDDSNNEIIMLV